MRNKIITLVAVAIIVAGTVILLYPVVSNIQFLNSQQELAEYYENQIQDIPEEEVNTMLEQCYEYNDNLLHSKVKLTDPFDADELDLDEHPYIDLLNQNGDGAMGSLEIPAINCKLIVYHYTDADVLAKGIGHLQGTSLPVGGKGTHAVLSGHTGTADKELFTNLDQLRGGDVFYIHVVGEILAYQVDKIQVVLPNETEGLYIDHEKDLVTLVTCTPYGINSHRLLVRGVRIPYEKAKQIEQSKGRINTNTWQTQYFYAILVGLALSAVVVGIIAAVSRMAGKNKGDKQRKGLACNENKNDS